MVKIPPTLEDLVPGKSWPPHVFQSIGLKVGSKIENNNGQKLIVQSAPFSQKWYLVPLEDTNLENQTQELLESEFELVEGRHFVKQHIPEGLNRRIDFAIPLIRLAIEPHASYLWEVNDGVNEEEKERELEQFGWDVLWLDEDNLSEGGDAYRLIETAIHRSMRNVLMNNNEGIEFVTKGKDGFVEYDWDCVNDALEATVYHEETVVFQGEVVPRTWAELHPDSR